MTKESMAGPVLLSLAGMGLGALLVDYATSKPGASLLDSIGRKFGLMHGRSVSSSAYYYPAAHGAPPPMAHAAPPPMAYAAPPPMAHVFAHPAPAATPTTLAPIAPLAEIAARLGVPPSIRPEDLSTLIARFQSSVGLLPSGRVDAQTLDVLRQLPSSHYVGAQSWEDETTSLGPEAQAVIRHAMTQETHSGVLARLGSALSSAGFPQSASMIQSKVHSSAATSGWWA